MSVTSDTRAPLRHPDRFFIGGEWVEAVVRRHDRRHRLRHRGAVLPGRRGPGRRHRRARSTAARKAFDDGPVAADDPRRAGRVPARDRRRACAARPTTSSQIWPRESGVLHARRPARADRDRRDLRVLRRPGRHLPVRGARRSPTAGGEFGLLVREPVGVVGAIIPWNAPLGAHRPQDRARAARRLHGGAQGVAGGSRGGATSMAEIAEAVGTAAGRAQRRHRRPRGLRAAGARPARRQDRVHRARPRPAGASRRSAASASRAAPSSWAASRRPSSSTTSTSAEAAATLAERRVLPDRPGVLVADPHRRQPQAPRRARRGARRHVLAGAGRRPVRHGHADGAAGHASASATGSRATSPRASTRAPRSPPAAAGPSTSSAAASSSPRCSATSTTPRRSPGRRSSARCSASSPPTTRRTRSASPTTPSTASTPRCSPTTSTGPARSPGSCAPARSGTTPSAPTSASAFGGFKQSGIGREGGLEGLLPYLETKTVILNEVPAEYQS